MSISSQKNTSSHVSSKKTKNKAIKIFGLEKQFNEEVIKIIQSGADMVDAVVTWCSKNGVEVEVAASMIKANKSLKSKMTDDAEDLNFIRSRNT